MYRLILLDFSMPEMDGPELARELKKLFFQSTVFLVEQKPFICCCTAYSDPSFRKVAFEAGMEMFITKPVSNEDLDKVLKLSLS